MPTETCVAPTTCGHNICKQTGGAGVGKRLERQWVRIPWHNLSREALLPYPSPRFAKLIVRVKTLSRQLHECDAEFKMTIGAVSVR